MSERRSRRTALMIACAAVPLLVGALTCFAASAQSASGPQAVLPANTVSMAADRASPTDYAMPDDVEYFMTCGMTDIVARCDFGPAWHSVEALREATGRPEYSLGSEELRELSQEANLRHYADGPMCSLVQALTGPEPRGMYAVLLLGTLDNPEAFEAVVECMGDPDPGHRTAAIKALGYIGDRRGVPYLLSEMEDLEGGTTAGPTYRQRPGQLEFPGLLSAYDAPLHLAILERRSNAGLAAQALGRLRDARAVPRLMELLRDDECDFRDVVADALGHIGDPSALPLLKEMAEQGRVLPWTRRAVLNIEARQKTAAQLIVDLESENAEVRGYAVVRLGEIGDETAIPAFERLSRDRAAFKTNAGSPSKLCAISYLARQAIEQIRARRQPEAAGQGTPPVDAGQR